jgi:hypothetical protein
MRRRPLRALLECASQFWGLGLLTSVAIVLFIRSNAFAFDGSVSLELSGGNRTLSGSLIGDWGIVPDKVYLMGSYGIVRQLPASGLRSEPSHLFGLGVDLVPSMHWVTSVSLSFSPKAGDVQHTDLGDVTYTRRSAQGLMLAAWQSGGVEPLEGGFDLSLLSAWYDLSSLAELQSLGRFEAAQSLLLLKPSAGVTLTVSTTSDLCLRGSYTWYSSDPTTAGGFDDRVPAAVRTTHEFQQIEAQFGRAEAGANFSSAPPWFDLKATFVHRFGEKVIGRVAYTYTRYVHGLGNAHALGTQWTWRVAGWARLWAGATVQVDRTGPLGYGVLGAELATE